MIPLDSLVCALVRALTQGKADEAKSYVTDIQGHIGKHARLYLDSEKRLRIYYDAPIKPVMPGLRSVNDLIGNALWFAASYIEAVNVDGTALVEKHKRGTSVGLVLPKSTEPDLPLPA